MTKAFDDGGHPSGLSTKGVARYLIEDVVRANRVRLGARDLANLVLATLADENIALVDVTDRSATHEHVWGIWVTDPRDGSRQYRGCFGCDEIERRTIVPIRKRTPAEQLRHWAKWLATNDPFKSKLEAAIALDRLADELEADTSPRLDAASTDELLDEIRARTT